MYEFLEYQVADAMTYHPVTIARSTPLADVEALFERHDFNCLPVSEDGALLGIVTKLDVIKAFAFTTRTMVPPYAEIMNQPAESVMTLHPTTVSPDVSLTRVLQLMAETRFRSFPVVIGALLIGMISREDVLRALARAAAGIRPRSGAGSWREDAVAHPGRGAGDPVR
jgi:CBS domain-containing protein